MNDEQLLRYSRQILLPQIDLDGQEKLRAARVLVIGAGGLGSPVAIYLAAAGIGQIALTDHDTVDLSNLQRQILHGTPDLGRPKVESARDALQRLNPDVVVDALPHRLEDAELLTQVEAADVVLDCCDNFTTRFAVNAACVATGTPLVSGAVIRFEGQIAVFHPQQGGPCYNCLYPNHGELDASCARNGVIAPLPGIVGSMQALEAIKLIVGIGQTLSGRLMLLDALTMEWSSFKLPRDPNCPTCSQAH